MPDADAIIHGGRILSFSDGPAADAIAISGNRIVALGTLAELRSQSSSKTRELNLEGRVLMPSLKDHHIHLQAIGFALLNREREGKLFLDLSSASSEREMVDRVAERARAEPPGTWIVGASWNENYWEGRRAPTHHALSKALPDHPAFLVRVDSHSALVNERAMQLAGITTSTANPPGGEIRRMPDGSLSGMLIERAVESVLDRMPVPSDALVRDATRLAARTMADRGYSHVYDAGIMHFPGLVALNSPMDRWIGILRDLDEVESLPIYVNLMVAAPSQLAEQVMNGQLPRQLSPRVRYTHLKLYADGAFGSRGALMYEPYSDDPANCGIERMTEEEMFAYARRAISVGLDVAIHAIGDLAVTRVLNVYERTLGAIPNLNPRRLRLEHFSVAVPEDIERAARLGILLVAQPGFVWPMPNGICMEDYRLGQERVRRAYVWHTLLDRGAQLTGSSDDYGLPPHSFWNVHAACERTNPELQPDGGWQGQERISRDEALRMFTDFALPGGDVSRGELIIGAPADMMICSDDPRTVGDLLALGVAGLYRTPRM